MKSLWSAVFALAVAGAAWADDNDDETKKTRVVVEEEYLDLLRRVSLLEQAQQETELDRLKRQAAKEKQEEMENLPKRVSELEKKQSSAGQTWDASKML